MSLKNVIKPDHAAMNQYELAILGLPKIVFTKVSGLEDETDGVDLPDRTHASGGQSKPFEITAEMPTHHDAEMAALELWLQEGRDPVTPTYKKSGVMIYKKISGEIAKTYSLLGMWCKKQKTPEVEMANEGEQAFTEWTFSIDEKLPI